MWIYGVALLGRYGTYFPTSQLFSEYVTVDRHIDPTAGGIAVFIDPAGWHPGEFARADRSRNLRMFVFVPLVVVSALLILIPVVPDQAPRALGIAAIVPFALALVGLTGRNLVQDPMVTVGRS